MSVHGKNHVIKTGSRRGLWSSANLAILLATVLLLVGATLIGRAVLFSRSATTSSNSTSTSQPDRETKQTGQNGVTKDYGSDAVPPNGQTTLTFTGSGTRASHTKPLNYDWTGLWSVNCSDQGGKNQLVIWLFSSSSPGDTLARVLLTKTYSVSGYQSGSFKGISTPQGSFEVSSTCDWTLTVVNTDVPAA